MGGGGGGGPPTLIRIPHYFAARGVWINLLRWLLELCLGRGICVVPACSDKQLCQFRMASRTISIHPGLEGLGFRVQGLGLVQGLGFRV